MAVLRAGAALAAALAVPAASAAFSPVIGVLTEPLDEGAPGSYLEDWYVRWVEAQGARAVPLRFDAPATEIDDLLSRVNGVLFPGGGVAIKRSSAYGAFGSRVFDAAVKAKMPMWGTCLGFEMLMLYSSGEASPGPLTDGWDSEQLQLPLNLTSAGKASALVAGWPRELRAATAATNVTWHFHQSGVAVADFERREALKKFWTVVATNVDLRGREFVSVVEARGGLPFFATQFHPEKNANEFEIGNAGEGVLTGGDAVHSEAAVEMANRLAQHFVGRARGFRGFGFSSQDFWKASIRAWPARSAGGLPGLAHLPPHMQVYYFPAEGHEGDAGAALLV